MGTQDDQAPPTIKTEAARAGQTGAEGLNYSKPAANDAEALYWASLSQQAEQKAQALAIEGWGTGTDGPIQQAAQAKIAEVYYFHTDQVGLPEELSNSQGQLVWQATYKTWGNTQAEEWKLVEADGSKTHPLDAGDQPENEARHQNLRFQGQYLDRDTGLHYNTFRFYDPDIGRFISPDPIGLEGGINLGSYSPNPISWIDPLGWINEELGNVLGSNRNSVGVYRFRGSDGKIYVGSTTDQNFGARLQQHVNSGKLPAGNIGNVEVISMNGSTPQQIYNMEASEIQRNGGRSVDGGDTSNNRAPPGTRDKFKDPQWMAAESKKSSRFKGRCKL